MRRSWLIAAVVLGILAIAIAIAAIAVRVGEDGSSELTAEWADSVCTSLADWHESVSLLADLGDPSVGVRLRDRLDEAEGATSTLVTELRNLGPPDVANGEEVERALDDAVGGVANRYEELHEAASDAAEARSGPALAGLADDFQALLEQARDLVATLQSASLFGEASTELEQAFADSASCRSLQTKG